jgi:dCTP deaminase
MGLKHDGWIKEQASKGMIDSFEGGQVKTDVNGSRIISYGTSSYGYDTRMAGEFKLTRILSYDVLDPKNLTDSAWEPTVYSDSFVIPPHGFVLTRTVEYFRIPADVLCVVLGKSTYARVGLIVNATPLEPAWEGHITLELTNPTPLPIRIYANEGIAQILFFEGDEPALENYASKQGKYMRQQGIVMARV